MITANFLVRLGTAVMCLALLSSCNWLWNRVDTCRPGAVQFPTDIVSGTYSGWLEDYPLDGGQTQLQLILEPEYLDDREYSLRGDFVLGDADALELSATVHGGCASRYQPENVEIGPQMTAPMGEVMNGKVHSNGVLVWEIHQHIIGARLDPARLHGRMRNIDLNESFNFVVTRSEP